MRPATGTNEGERVEFLRKKIKRLRMTAIELVAELEGLRRVGHARTQGVETRLVNVGNSLCRAYFELEFGVRLLNENIGPRDQAPEDWSNPNLD